MQTKQTADELQSLDLSQVFETELEELPAPRQNCYFTSDGRLKSWIDDEGYAQWTDIPENAHVLALEKRYQDLHGGQKHADHSHSYVQYPASDCAQYVDEMGLDWRDYLNASK